MTCNSVVCKLHFLVCKLWKFEVIISKHARATNFESQKHLRKPIRYNPLENDKLLKKTTFAYQDAISPFWYKSLNVCCLKQVLIYSNPRVAWIKIFDMLIYID